MEYVRQKRAVDSGPLVNYSGTSDYFLFSHVYVLPEVRNSWFGVYRFIDDKKALYPSPFYLRRLLIYRGISYT
jgi:hypothetical protein